MRTLDVETFTFDGSDESLFHRGLRRFAFLVRRQTEIAVGDKVDCIHKSAFWLALLYHQRNWLTVA
jgi:hypothetical protein